MGASHLLDANGCDSLFIFSEGRFTDAPIDDYLKDVIRPIIKERGNYSDFRDWVVMKIFGNRGGEYTLEITCYQNLANPDCLKPNWEEYNTYIVRQSDFPVIVYCAKDCEIIKPIGKEIKIRKWYVASSLVFNDETETIRLKYKDRTLKFLEMYSFYYHPDSIPLEKYYPKTHKQTQRLDRYFTPPIDSSILGLSEFSILYNPI